MTIRYSIAALFYRRLTTTLTLSALVVMGTFVFAFLWLYVIDPISPIQEIRDSRIATEGPIRHSNGFVAIQRTYCSSRDAMGTVAGEFLSAPSMASSDAAQLEAEAQSNSQPAILGQRSSQVVVSQTEPQRHSLTPVPMILYKGCQQWYRIWAIPASLLPGTYQFRSHLTFCNLVRCKTIPTPFIENVVIVP